jgi:hypothetical protein
MSATTREFIDFWIENSVHAREQYRAPGAEQNVDELTRRLIEAAKDQSITEAALRTEVGDLATFIREKLRNANRDEDDRHP